jgi:hypothetical protein
MGLTQTTDFEPFGDYFSPFGRKIIPKKKKSTALPKAKAL